MRHFRLPLVLQLLALLLFAQQGAELHELSHLYYSGQALGAQLQGDKGLPDNNYCPTCQAFSQVAHPATGSPVLFVPRAASLPPLPVPLYSTVDASAPTPRSRGPPHFAI